MNSCRFYRILWFWVLLTMKPWFKALAQDLQFECISCADKLDKCELDCSWNNQDAKQVDITHCHSRCSKRFQDSCVDSDDAIRCSTCALSCAEIYDADLRKCLSAIDPSSKMTFGSAQGKCSSAASSAMRSCTMACSPQI